MSAPAAAATRAAPPAAVRFARAAWQLLARGARAVVLAPILLYSRVISPALPRRCRYEPTCSAYAVQAVQGYGVLKGLVLAIWRLLRCNPFSDGGYDPVEAQRLFKTERHAGA